MQKEQISSILEDAHLSGSNADYLEQLYEDFLQNQAAVSDDFSSFFQNLPSNTPQNTTETPHSSIRQQFLLLAKNKTPIISKNVGDDVAQKQIAVLRLIQAFRMRGHQAANLDPLGLWQREVPADLTLAHYGFSESDLDTVFKTGVLYFGTEQVPLRQIYTYLQQTYCAAIGAEFMHIGDSEQRHWFAQKLESTHAKLAVNSELQKHILERLTAAEGLEKYLGTKYPGVKRFGLEGGESLIVALDDIIQRCGSYGVKEIVIGMAHRGRLNVLVNNFGKNPRDLFAEFDGKKDASLVSGDVKYHQGFSSNVMTASGEVHLALAFNPSHLEIVSPVVEGSVRARQDRREDKNGAQVVPITIHGDASIAGQGIVMETLQMSQTRAYGTGGTIRIVINNQVGFTTSNPQDARSTEYATDIAKMVNAPILHVNGDDPEAVLFATQLAVEYRMQFKRDVVIDIVCYRRRGHNEADEPNGTQPLMYQKISKQATTRELYANYLIKNSVIDENYANQVAYDYRVALDEGKHVAKSLVTSPNSDLFVNWKPYLGHVWTAKHDTSLDINVLRNLAHKLVQLPDGFVLQRQVDKVMEDRAKMTAGDIPINWGYAENLAYATLLHEGHPVRITGQDVGRGTFSHRHAQLHNQQDGSTYLPLQHLSVDQPQFTLHDSFLSEAGVLAFEYGYATTSPNALVVWEAQFGDFANGAQVVFDQFISSGEHKWGRLCGLVVLLPHGYEGQGPEHSSARLERYLQLCAQHNMQVCVPTTPAQVYHMLRRQMVRPLRKPLIALTPKSLLRHPQAISTMQDLASGAFQTVIDEAQDLNKSKITKLILCSGKVYYDLLNARTKNGATDTAIIRIEQLYPFPEDDLQEILSTYPNLAQIVWCQEEPMNQGAWYCSNHHLRHAAEAQNAKLQFAGRKASSAPACGYAGMHAQEQQELINEAFTI